MHSAGGHQGSCKAHQAGNQVSQYFNDELLHCWYDGPVDMGTPFHTPLSVLLVSQTPPVKGRQFAGFLACSLRYNPMEIKKQHLTLCV